MSKRAWTGGGVVAAVAAIVLVGVLMTAASGQDATTVSGAAHTITVTSTATIGTQPDEAVVTFSVHSEDAASTVALNETARSMNDVVAAMKALGIKQVDRQTTNISLSPKTIDRGTSSESTLYGSSSSLTVKVHDFGIIGEAIQKGVRAGATSVRGVRFQVADPVGAKEGALRAAVESARAKADALASAAGAQVTGVVQIRETGAPPVPRPYYVRNAALASERAAPSLPVLPPHAIQTKVSIAVIWSIS